LSQKTPRFSKSRYNSRPEYFCSGTYFHQNGRGLNITFAKGLAAFLNSSLVDSFFRQFNGHTQVNATDLRNLKYPSAEQLYALGQHIETIFPTQEKIDALNFPRRKKLMR
jgi:hypothetical protein